MMLSPQSCLPIVYSCSGCSSAAQMANFLALRLDREGWAEMSCIAGVGGNVPQLVKIARAGRPIFALDGCPLACAKSCLNQRGVAPDVHLVLSKLGVRKHYHAEFDRAEAEALLVKLRETARALGRQNGPNAVPEDLAISRPRGGSEVAKGVL